MVHLGFVDSAKLKQLRPGDDADQVRFYSLTTRAKLAFDHALILRYAARWLKNHRSLIRSASRRKKPDTQMNRT